MGIYIKTKEICIVCIEKIYVSLLFYIPSNTVNSYSNVSVIKLKIIIHFNVSLSFVDQPRTIPAIWRNPLKLYAFTEIIPQWSKECIWNYLSLPFVTAITLRNDLQNDSFVNVSTHAQLSVFVSVRLVSGHRGYAFASHWPDITGRHLWLGLKITWIGQDWAPDCHVYLRPYAGAIRTDFIPMDDNARPHHTRVFMPT